MTIKNNRININLFKIAVVLIGSLFLVSCSGKQVTTLKLSIISDKELNKDQQNTSSPLMLKFYELTSAEKFTKLSYWDILDGSGSQFSSDIISQQKHVITPSQKQVYNIKFENNAKFLGVVGQFYNIKKPTWKYVVEIKKGANNEAELKLKDYSIMELNDEK